MACIAGQAVALQSDGTGVTDVFEGGEEGRHVEAAMAEGLDPVACAGLDLIGGVGSGDGDGEEVGFDGLQGRAEVFLGVGGEVVAEVEHDADGGAFELFEESQGVGRSFEPVAAVGIEGESGAVWVAEVGDLVDEVEGLGIEGGVGGLLSADDDGQHCWAIVEEWQELFEARVVRFFGLVGEVDSDVDLEEGKGVLVE